MTSIHPASSTSSVSALITHLRTLPTPLLPPAKPLDVALTDQIASLYVHPALEALLHILNWDLPSAHFLVRHMQSPPAYEGMYVHGILHRIEGDVDNARAWYADVGKFEGFTAFWGDVDDMDDDGGKGDEGAAGKKMPKQRRAREFLDAVERVLTGGVGKGKGEEEGGREELERMSRGELDSLLDWCVRQFGTDRLLDAREAWVQNSGEIAAKGQKMVSGEGGGHRKF